MELDDSVEALVEKRIRRIFAAARTGFYHSLGRDRLLSTMFLTVMIEANKALQELRGAAGSRGDGGGEVSG